MGLEFARQLAERGYGIVVISDRSDENRRAAESLRERSHADVRVIDLDLTLPEAAETIYREVSDWRLEVEILVSNASDRGVALRDPDQVDSPFRAGYVEATSRLYPDHRLLDRLDALSDHLALCGDKGFPEIFLTVGLV